MAKERHPLQSTLRDANSRAPSKCARLAHARSPRGMASLFMANHTDAVIPRSASLVLHPRFSERDETTNHQQRGGLPKRRPQEAHRVAFYSGTAVDSIISA